jgi:hypothetical protein
MERTERTNHRLWGGGESEAEVRHRWSLVAGAIQSVVSTTGFSLFIRRPYEFNRLKAVFQSTFNSCNINTSQVEGKLTMRHGINYPRCCVIVS